MQMDGWEAYDINDVNPVMDAMEARIKELEAENKHLEDYIDAYQKSEALNIEKMDKKDERIKELEKCLENCALKTNEELIKNLAKTCREYTQYNLNLQHNIDAKNAKINELEAVISKMEITQKWISVKDRFPCEDGEYQVVYKHKNGALVSSFDEWDNDCQDWMNATDRAAVVFWAELLPPPTTEEK